MKTNYGGLEETLLSGGGLAFALALVHYSDPGHNYKDNPVKVMFGVTNAADMLQRIQAAGQTIVAQPSVVPALGNATVGIAKDPDGYTLELMQR